MSKQSKIENSTAEESSAADINGVETRTEHKIRCSEIWGGSQNADLDVSTNGLSAAVFSASCNGESGGDVYYFAVCDSNVLTRIVLADLRGHGDQVRVLSSWIFEALRESMSSLDGSAILAKLNHVFYEKGLDAITTATIVSFYLGDSHLYVANAGHPPVLLRRLNEREWLPVEVGLEHTGANLPLGAFENTPYDQVSIPLRSGERLALYTDGFVESSNSQDEDFGEQRLRALLQAHGDLGLHALKTELVSALVRHVGGSFDQDDVTLLLAEVGQTPARSTGVECAATIKSAGADN